MRIRLRLESVHWVNFNVFLFMELTFGFSSRGSHMMHDSLEAEANGLSAVADISTLLLKEVTHVPVWFLLCRNVRG